MFELRPYQAECVKRVVASYEANKSGRELIVLPTAAGKTVVFSHVIDALNKCYGTAAMVVAHRDELLQQAADKYRMVKPEAVIGKVGSGTHEYGGELTVAGIATISRPEHLKRLRALFGTGRNLLIIVDEGHHIAAPGYQKVLETLPDAFVLIVTATADRMDGKQIIDKPPLYQESILDMIPQGYLCDLKAVAIKTDVSLDDLHTSMGDYNEKELEEAIDTPARNGLIVRKYQEYTPGKRAVAFCVTITHAQHLAEAFCQAGVKAATITGDTPLDERKKIYKAFRAGDILVMTNVMVLSEGWDEPLCEVGIGARPTQSRALYVQQLGRILRLAPGKQFATWMDITDNCFKHRLEPQSLSKAIGKQIKDEETLTEALAREERESNEREVVVRKLKEQRKEDLTVNLLAKLEWQQKGDMYILEIGSQKHRIALAPSKDFEGYYSVYARLAPFYEGQCWLQNSPLDWCQSFAEREARKLLADPKSVKLIDRNARWRSDKATETQLEKLAKYKDRFKLQYDEATVTKGEASDMLDMVYSKFEEYRNKRKQMAV